MSQDDEQANSTVLAVIFGCLIIIWVIRALLKGADQSK